MTRTTLQVKIFVFICCILSRIIFESVFVVMIIFNLYLDSFSGIQEKDSYLDALNLENKLLKEENARLRMKLEALKALKQGIHKYIPGICS